MHFVFIRGLRSNPAGASGFYGIVSEGYPKHPTYPTLGPKPRTLNLKPETNNSLLQQPGPKKFKLSKIELIYKAKTVKVPPFTI